MSKIDPSAEPGTIDTSALKETTKKVAHPFIGVEDPNVYPFPAPQIVDGVWTSGKPDDFDPEVHLPLKKVDFAEDWQFQQCRIEDLDRKLEALVKIRDESKAMGSSKERAAAKRLTGMAKRIAEIQSKLAAGNVDTAAILKAAGVDMDALKALVNAAD